MASSRFYGAVGYATSVEMAEGVWDDVVTEKKYRGNVERNVIRRENSEDINSELTASNSISVVADAYANQHFHSIVYVEWAGTRWTVTSVEVLRPRLLLRLGGVYNGTLPATPAPGSP